MLPKCQSALSVRLLLVGLLLACCKGWRDGTCHVKNSSLPPPHASIPGARCGRTRGYYMEKGKRENLASFFLRTGFHFSQCPRGLPRPPRQGSEDTGKGARLGWWQGRAKGNAGLSKKCQARLLEKWKPWPCPTGCEAPLAGREGATIPHSRSGEGQEL